MAFFTVYGPTVPNVTWSDVGGLTDVKEELEYAILDPVWHREQYESLGLGTSCGILLFGPPGCGKTLLAKAVEKEFGIHFISFLNMYVGASEHDVRQCFQRARSAAPCIIFFDEFDALCPKKSEDGTSAFTSRLMAELDDLEDREQVFVLAATNRPDMLDPAMLQPGRLDKMLYVRLPGPSDRADILRALTKNGTKPKLSSDVDLDTLARDTRLEGFTGADLAALVRKASILALKESMKQNSVESVIVSPRHSQDIPETSVTADNQKMYEEMKPSSSHTSDTQEQPVHSFRRRRHDRQC